MGKHHKDDSATSQDLQSKADEFDQQWQESLDRNPPRQTDTPALDSYEQDKRS